MLPNPEFRHTVPLNLIFFPSLYRHYYPLVLHKVCQDLCRNEIYQLETNFCQQVIERELAQ
jgi:hypothetical protein